jgi:hypothetical protein
MNKLEVLHARPQMKHKMKVLMKPWDCKLFEKLVLDSLVSIY